MSPHTTSQIWDLTPRLHRVLLHVPKSESPRGKLLLLMPPVITRLSMIRSHDNNHQTTNTLTEQLHLMLLQKSENFVQRKMWQIWFCFTHFNIQHRSSSICPALGLVKFKVKLVRKRLHFVFEMSTWSYDFYINPLLKCSQRAGCVEMQILSEPVTGQTFIFHCTEHTLSFSKGRTRNGLIHS